MASQSSPAPQQLYRRAGIALIIASTLVLLALSHHPVVGVTASAGESLARLAALQFKDGLVHGALMLMLTVLAAAMASFSSLLGARRPPVVMACAAYGAGCCVMVGAMLLDGFAVPQIAHKFMAAPASDVQTVLTILAVIGTIIQVLTKAGIIAMGIAMLAWSYALAERPMLPWSRWCAAAGAVAGLLPLLFLGFGAVRLRPASLMLIFAVHGGWNLAVAAMLLQASRRQ